MFQGRKFFLLLIMTINGHNHSKKVAVSVQHLQSWSHTKDNDNRHKHNNQPQKHTFTSPLYIPWPQGFLLLIMTINGHDHSKKVVVSVKICRASATQKKNDNGNKHNNQLQNNTFTSPVYMPLSSLSNSHLKDHEQLFMIFENWIGRHPTSEVNNATHSDNTLPQPHMSQIPTCCWLSTSRHWQASVNQQQKSCPTANKAKRNSAAIIIVVPVVLVSASHLNQFIGESVV
jgi:hypothetical protein